MSRRAPRRGAPGPTRVQREIERAERLRRRRQRSALIAGVVGGVLVLVTVIAIMAGPGRSSASAAPVQKVAAVTQPRVPTGTQPVADDAQSSTSTAPAPKASPATVAPVTPKATVTPSTKAQAKPKAPTAKKASSTAQHFDVQIGAAGYEPSVVTAASGGPVTLTVGKGEGCAAGFLVPSLGIDKDNSSGPVTVKLGTLKPGTYGFSCGMGMVRGRLVVR